MLSSGGYGVILKESSKIIIKFLLNSCHANVLQHCWACCSHQAARIPMLSETELQARLGADREPVLMGQRAQHWFWF